MYKVTYTRHNIGGLERKEIIFKEEQRAIDFAERKHSTATGFDIEVYDIDTNTILLEID